MARIQLRIEDLAQDQLLSLGRARAEGAVVLLVAADIDKVDAALVQTRHE
jgi:hypothetical protein